MLCKHCLFSNFQASTACTFKFDIFETAGLKVLTYNCRQLSAAQRQLAESKRQAEESTSRAAGMQGLTAELASLKVRFLGHQIGGMCKHQEEYLGSPEVPALVL